MFTQHYLSFLVNFLEELWNYNVASTVTYQVIFHLNFNHPWQYFTTSCWQEKGRVSANGWNSSIIHVRICSLIHKKCKPKSYHSDTKYHITLNIIFSVLDQGWAEMNLLVQTIIPGHEISAPIVYEHAPDSMPILLHDTYQCERLLWTGSASLSGAENSYLAAQSSAQCWFLPRATTIRRFWINQVSSQWV